MVRYYTSLPQPLKHDDVPGPYYLADRAKLPGAYTQLRAAY
jgi:hypothetical protein